MYFKRDPRNNRLVIYHYRDGRTRVLPKALYAHLESQPDSNIRTWIEDYERLYVKAKVTPDHLIGPDMSRKLEQFEAWLKDVKGQDYKTYKQHCSLLLNHAIPYFTRQDPPLIDPNQWPGASTGLLAHLMEKELKATNIKRVNIALRMFFGWLQDTGAASTAYTLRLWTVKDKSEDLKDTSLKVFLSPEKALELARNMDCGPRLMLLLGYFFSLRPQETFNLKRSDFTAGNTANVLECCRAMAKHKLFDRFAVNVIKQRGIEGEKGAKTKGWVACFSQDAAKIVVELLNKFEPDEPLFPGRSRSLYKLWAAQGLDMTLKDLRRASLYHLGHHTTFSNSAIELMKHARHRRLDTTMLYLRRPDEVVAGGPMLLDLEA